MGEFPKNRDELTSGLLVQEEKSRVLNMLLDHLRKETATQHHALESTLIFPKRARLISSV